MGVREERLRLPVLAEYRSEVLRGSCDPSFVLLDRLEPLSNYICGDLCGEMQIPYEIKVLRTAHEDFYRCKVVRGERPSVGDSGHGNQAISPSGR